MDLRTFHPGGIAIGRRQGRAVQAPIEAAAHPTAGAARRDPDVAALLTGSSMRLLEAGLAVVAIGTALLLGLGR